MNTSNCRSIFHRSLVTRCVVRSPSVCTFLALALTLCLNACGGSVGTNTDSSAESANEQKNSLLSFSEPSTSIAPEAPVYGVATANFTPADATVAETAGNFSGTPKRARAHRLGSKYYTLTVVANSAGSVTSSVGGIACSKTGSCSARFLPGTPVVMLAKPKTGFNFINWGGSCVGTLPTCTLVLSADRTVSPTYADLTHLRPTPSLTPEAQSKPTPSLLYTDIVSGPTTGGEGNNGVYLSIFGKDFGVSGLGNTTKVYVGTTEVASYRYLGVSKSPGIQQITVQVGALSGVAQGAPLQIKVVVNGVSSNSNLRFTPNPGRMLYVDNVSGNDATAVPGDITKPYRYVQTPALYTGGAWQVARGGDVIVMRGHGTSNPWKDVGFEHYFMRVADRSGSAPTGASGTGPIAIMGYPNEDTFIRGTLSGGMTGGCFSGINGQTFLGKGQWVTISNLRIDCEGYDGPISQQIYGHNWRIVNNDLSESTAPRTGSSVPRMGGITGNGQNAFWYGNEIHDIQGSSGECHGIYIDGDGSYDIAYNYVHDIRDGNGFQVYVNGSNGSNVSNNISLHHNLIRNVSKHGLNIADGARNNVKIWNNIVYNVQYSAIRFNTANLHGAQVFNNTFYNTNIARNNYYGAISNDWTLAAGSVDIENNIFVVVENTPYNSGSNGVPASAGIISKNLWFNSANSTSFDSAPVTHDPKFVTPGSDFHLQIASPAIGVGAVGAPITALVTTDFDTKIRSTMTLDLGALKY